MYIFKSVSRGLTRIALLAAIGAANLLATSYAPELLGSTFAPLAFGFGLCLLGLAGGDLALRILQPHVDTQAAAGAAMAGNLGAGFVYLGRCILAAVVLMLVVTASRADTPPAAAVPYLPLLKAEQVRYWADMPMPSALGSQVEQETCTSLKSKGCWNPRAELRTSREQGVGLGQLTRAFRANGTTRFDALAELKQSYPKELASLTWDRPYDPAMQLRAVVLKDLQNYTKVSNASTEYERIAMTFAAYNGGMGGLSSDRVACAGTPGCDPGRWFGHVEHTSLKAKTAVAGYGQSFFAINRGYVANVMVTRRVRYLVLERT